MRTNRLSRLALCLFILQLSPAFAQTDRATLTGAVTDPTQKASPEPRSRSRRRPPESSM